MIMENETYTVFQVADWFLSKSAMTPKKLQKIVYYAYAWTLTLMNDKVNDLQVKLFEDDHIEAWVHGPVMPNLYAKYRQYGYQVIDKQDDVEVVFNEDVQDVLQQVWDIYGDYNADQLESITHQESPWKKARVGLSVLESSNDEINDADIFNYYIKRVG